MAKIHGEIASLSELKCKLGNIYQPNTVADIIVFKNNFPNAPSQINKEAKEEILREINNLKSKLKELSAEYDKKIKEREGLLIKEKNNIESKINIYSVKQSNIFLRLYYAFKLWRLSKRKFFLNNYFDDEKKRPFKNLGLDISSIDEKLQYKEKNIDKLIEERAKPRIKKLNTINSLLLENNMLYEGAIGEQQVFDELKKLPDSFSIINDFQKLFRKGIYQKRTGDWIYSIQVDHIVIGPTGIFVIETKNWSQNSINNEHIFSPVKQVNRARHALYCYLNDAIKDGYLSSFEHHWGLRQISPSSIIVTIHHTPQQEFQYVKILSLKDIFWYITSRKKISSENNVNELTEFLLRN